MHLYYARGKEKGMVTSMFKRNAFRKACLVAGIGILVPQALTLQRSLRHVATLDWIIIGLLWIIVPALISFLWIRYPRWAFTRFGDVWMLSIGSVIQALMLLLWPATISPSSIYTWINGNLVTFSGSGVQSGIICTTLCLIIHSVVINPTEDQLRDRNNTLYYIISISAGLGIAGLGLSLALFFGWTMYLLPSVLIWIFLDILFLFSNRNMKSKKEEGEKQEKIVFSEIRSAYTSLWSVTVFSILPFLLLS
ncbi:MAG: hypothetical protein ACFFCS_12085, partial [Candidatus Hodarchaeota archaeon]